MASDSLEYRSPAAFFSEPRKWARDHPCLADATVIAGALAMAAVTNHRLAKRAERRNPPSGGFIEVEGVHLHYVDRGDEPPVVLLHGNGSMIQDFATSGLIDLAARDRRFIVLDRPGYPATFARRSSDLTSGAWPWLLRQGCVKGCPCSHAFRSGAIAVAKGRSRPTPAPCGPGFRE